MPPGAQTAGEWIRASHVLFFWPPRQWRPWKKRRQQAEVWWFENVCVALPKIPVEPKSHTYTLTFNGWTRQGFTGKVKGMHAPCWRRSIGRILNFFFLTFFFLPCTLRLYYITPLQIFLILALSFALYTLAKTTLCTRHRRRRRQERGGRFIHWAATGKV